MIFNEHVLFLKIRTNLDRPRCIILVPLRSTARLFGRFHAIRRVVVKIMFGPILCLVFPSLWGLLPLVLTLILNDNLVLIYDWLVFVANITPLQIGVVFIGTVALFAFYRLLWRSSLGVMLGVDKWFRLPFRSIFGLQGDLLFLHIFGWLLNGLRLVLTAGHRTLLTVPRLSIGYLVLIRHVILGRIDLSIALVKSDEVVPAIFLGLQTLLCAVVLTIFSFQRISFSEFPHFRILGFGLSWILMHWYGLFDAHRVRFICSWKISR